MNVSIERELVQLSDMMAIAKLAIEIDRLEQAAAEAKAELHESYETFKSYRGIDRVEIDTPEWAAMMDASKIEYQASEKAKRAVYNARRRMKSAIRRARIGGAA